jgi:hypothetical protein
VVVRVVAVVHTGADLAVHQCTAVAVDTVVLVECMEAHLVEEGM